MRKNSLSEICESFEYPFFPRLSIYRGREVEDSEQKIYFNTCSMGGKEQLNIREGNFTTQKISLATDLIAYLLQVDEMIRSSRDNRLRGNLILGIERLIGENFYTLNPQARRRYLQVDRYRGELRCDFTYENLRKICEKGKSDFKGRTITPTPAINGGRGDYRL